MHIVSVHCQEEGCIGKYIPRGPGDFPRAGILHPEARETDSGDRMGGECHVVKWLNSTFIPASDGSLARRVGTQPVRPGSNPGGACRSVSVSLDIGGSFVLNADDVLLIHNIKHPRTHTMYYPVPLVQPLCISIRHRDLGVLLMNDTSLGIVCML